jgi:hypothetical protein
MAGRLRQIGGRDEGPSICRSRRRFPSAMPLPGSADRRAVPDRRSLAPSHSM